MALEDENSKVPVSWADLVANEPVSDTEICNSSPVYNSFQAREPMVPETDDTAGNHFQEQESDDTADQNSESSSSDKPLLTPKQMVQLNLARDEKEVEKEDTPIPIKQHSKANRTYRPYSIQSSSPVEPLEPVYKEPIDPLPVYAYRPDELLEHMDDFTVGERRVEFAAEEMDSFITVNYKGRRCLIETPIATAVFGIKGYKTPGSKTQKYSLHISLGHGNVGDMEDFRLLLHKLDDWASAQYKWATDLDDKTGHTYWSPIRKGGAKSKKPMSLRIKIPCYQQRCNIDLYSAKGKCFKNPSIDQVRSMLPHKTQVRCIMAVNPIWTAGKKYGISYKLLKVKVVEEARNVEFRTN